MHKLIPVALLFAAASAQTVTYVAEAGPVVLYAGKGTGKMLSAHPDYPACVAAAAASKTVPSGGTAAGFTLTFA